MWNINDDASIVCKISNGEEAVRLLQEKGVELYSQKDILQIFHWA